MSTSPCSLFCIGNPLLDIQVRDGDKLLEKYGLKANDAILAEDKHAPIFEELLKDYKPTFVAGGAAQNAARAAAYVLPPKSVVYAGCVGDDELSHMLRRINEREGVESAYLVKQEERTGACAVIITDIHRSLVTTLRAAELFDPSHLSSPQVKSYIDNATHFYIEGFFVTHGLESALIIAKQAALAGKSVTVNLSAPFLVQYFKVQMEELLLYADVVIGNESEAAAWAAASGSDTEDLAQIATSIANLTKINTSRHRTVVITSGAEATVVASSAPGSAVRIYPVEKLDKECIVDTNGAGDCFAGGFVGALVHGKNLDEAVKLGHKLGAMCVGQVGPTLEWPKVNVWDN